jgi:hypothetical protein
VVIVVSGRALQSSLSEETLRERARELRETGAGARDVMEVLVREFGAPRNLAYRLAHQK